MIERAALAIADIDKAGIKAGKPITGWFSTYDNVDRVGRIMKLGAFGSTLGGQAHSGMDFTPFTVPMLGYHEDTMPVGASVMTPQATYGGRHESGLADTAFSKDMAALVAAGAVPATSMGWDPMTAVWTVNAQGFREFNYIDIMENSLCPCPANPLAVLDAASISSSGAKPAWESSTPQWVKDLWPDFARLAFREPEVIDLSRAAVGSSHTHAKVGGGKQTHAHDDADPGHGHEGLLPTPKASAAIEGAAGARHSAADQASIQAAHDHLAAAGATCAADDEETAAADFRAATTRLEKAMRGGRDVAAVQGSYEELQDLLRQGLRAAFPGQYPWVRATYADAVVFELDPLEAPALGATDAGTYRVTYVLDESTGEVTFGVPEPVLLKDVVVSINPPPGDAEADAVAALELEAAELEAEAISLG